MSIQNWMIALVLVWAVVSQATAQPASGPASADPFDAAAPRVAGMLLPIAPG